jgi:spore coat protein U-like protein
MKTISIMKPTSMSSSLGATANITLSQPSLTVYGVSPAGQSGATSGAYADTIVATVSF